MARRHEIRLAWIIQTRANKEAPGGV
jgi:hypothetical protein